MRLRGWCWLLVLAACADGGGLERDGGADATDSGVDTATSDSSGDAVVPDMTSDAPPSCTDGLQNGLETDIDCGGTECDACTNGLMCVEPSDCASVLCTEGTCTGSPCSDGVQNGEETDIDCGGTECDACGFNRMCVERDDCITGVCPAGLCSSCGDLELNGDETDVDCGGSCAECRGFDMCNVGSDCATDVCVDGRCRPLSCFDSMRSGEESAVDCGGPQHCPRCEFEFECTVPSDCASNTCMGGVCVAGPGPTFVRFTIFEHRAFTETDAEQDATATAACNAVAPGTRTATLREMEERRIAGMPLINTTATNLVPGCPGCEGSPSDALPSGHSRRCVGRGATIPSAPWTRATACHTGSHAAMCVRD